MDRRPLRQAKALATNILFGIDSSDDGENEQLQEAVDDFCDAEDAVNDLTNLEDDFSFQSEGEDGILEENFLVDLENTDEENSADENENNTDLISSDGTEWTLVTQRNIGRAPARNVCNFRQGFKIGLHPQSRSEAFEVFFHNCIDTATVYSNLYGRRKWFASNKNFKPISKTEMNAFLGLHILAGAYKATHRHSEELWSECDGHPIFRATISFERFKIIKSVLRFDDTLRRDRTDPAAAVRIIMDSFNSNILANYVPSPHLTLDEQLVEFHGRVKFRRYVPTKPGKYGLLLYWIADATNSIPLKGVLYIGEKTLSENDKKEGPFSEAISMKLAAPFLSKGRNITMDNYFTSISLANKLSMNNTTLVGTLRSNRRECPPIAKSTAGRKKGDTVHYTHNNITLSSFWDKKNKPVVLLSSMHPGEPYLDDRKCEIIEYYNSYKSGVDHFDKLVRTYRSQRKCCRWPYGIFFTLVDAACVTSYKLWIENNQETHYKFRKELAKELCLPLIKKRSAHPKLRASVRNAMSLCGIVFPKKKLNQNEESNKRGRCFLCPRSNDTKTKFMCNDCNNFVCKDHRDCVKAILCNNCV